MNLSSVDDRMLLENTKDLARQEREILVAILFHLKEVDRRRLYCDLKFDSLKEYAMTELKYSKDQADRRLAAMRLLNDLPEIQSAVESGALNLTNIVLAQVVFNKSEMDREERLEFLGELENKSTREAQKIAYKVCPDLTPKDLETFQLEDLELRHKAEKLIRYHGLENLNQLLNKLFDEELARIEETVAPRETAQTSAAPRSKAAIHREVRRRDKNTCTNCGSIFRPENDHIVPKAAGGSDTLENLRVLCRSCNQRAAIKYYGVEKMSQYLREPMTGYRVQ